MMSLLIVSSLLFIMAIITSKNRTRSRKSALWGAFILFLYMILSAFFVVSDYFTGEGINDAVIFHLAYGLDGSGFGDYYLIIAIGVAFFISSLVFSVVYYRWVKNDIFPMRRTTRYILSCVALIGAFMMHPSVHFIAESVLKVLGIENPIALRYRFNDYYQTPSLTSIDDEHMNLVYIFAESFENTYYNDIKQAAFASREIAEGSHGLRWNFAKRRMFEYGKADYTYSDSLQQVSYEMKHNRASITEHYLGG